MGGVGPGPLTPSQKAKGRRANVCKAAFLWGLQVVSFKWLGRHERWRPWRRDSPRWPGL